MLPSSQCNSYLNGFIVYKTYIGLKTHFTVEKYNWHRHLDNKKITFEAFSKRKDKELFKYFKMTRDELIELIISAMLQNNQVYIKEILDGVYNECHQDRMLTLSKIDYKFKCDILKLTEYVEENNITLKQLFISKLNKPLIATLYKKLDLALETVCLLDIYLKFTDLKNSNPIWIEECVKIKKYKKLLNIPNKTKIKKEIDVFMKVIQEIK